MPGIRTALHVAGRVAALSLVYFALVFTLRVPRSGLIDAGGGWRWGWLACVAISIGATGVGLVWWARWLRRDRALITIGSALVACMAFDLLAIGHLGIERLVEELMPWAYVVVAASAWVIARWTRPPVAVLPVARSRRAWWWPELTTVELGVACAVAVAAVISFGVRFGWSEKLTLPPVHDRASLLLVLTAVAIPSGVIAGVLARPRTIGGIVLAAAAGGLCAYLGAGIAGGLGYLVFPSWSRAAVTIGILGFAALRYLDAVDRRLVALEVGLDERGRRQIVEAVERHHP